MATQLRINDGTMKDGKLDEKLKWFRTDPVDEDSGVIIFQFETGGLSSSFSRKMSMSQVADKFEELAHRIRRYQNSGWPMYIAEGN